MPRSQPPARVTDRVIRAVRLAPCLVLVALTPVIVAAISGSTGSSQRLHDFAAVLLGNAALVTLAGSLALRPIAVMTGWTWHRLLARDLGLWTFALAVVDAAIVMMTSPSGPVGGLMGSAITLTGSLALLAMVPLAALSSRRLAQLVRLRFAHVQPLIYVVVALVLVHLLFSPEGPGEFAKGVLLLGPPLLYRLPPLERRLIARRHRRMSGRAIAMNYPT